MEKKIQILILILFALTGISIAQDISMPTDEEIMAVLDKYEFTKEQKEYLLKETRKTLQEDLNNKKMQNIMPESENSIQEDVKYKGSLIDLKEQE